MHHSGRGGHDGYHSLALGAQPVDDYLLDKHYLRKHGPGAYYGQSGK